MGILIDNFLFKEGSNNFFQVFPILHNECCLKRHALMDTELIIFYNCLKLYPAEKVLRSVALYIFRCDSTSIYQQGPADQQNLTD